MIAEVINDAWIAKMRHFQCVLCDRAARADVLCPDWLVPVCFDCMPQHKNLSRLGKEHLRIAWIMHLGRN